MAAVVASKQHFIISCQCELKLLLVLFPCLSIRLSGCQFSCLQPHRRHRSSPPTQTPPPAPSSFSCPPPYSCRNQLLLRPTRLPSHPSGSAPPPLSSSYPSDNKKGILPDQGDGKSVCESLGSCHFLISHCVAVLTGGERGGCSAGPWSRLGKQWQQRRLRPP